MAALSVTRRRWSKAFRTHFPYPFGSSSVLARLLVSSLLAACIASKSDDPDGATVPPLLRNLSSQFQHRGAF